MRIRDITALMGDDPRTHMKHHGRWADEQDTDDAQVEWLGRNQQRTEP